MMEQKACEVRVLPLSPKSQLFKFQVIVLLSCQGHPGNLDLPALLSGWGYRPAFLGYLSLPLEVIPLGFFLTLQNLGQSLLFL